MTKEEIKANLKANMASLKNLAFGEESVIAEVAEVTEVKLMEANLADGTVINIEPGLEVNASVSIMLEDGSEPAPDGSYELADGVVIVVEGGVITEIPEVEAEEDMEAAPVVAESNESSPAKVITERSEIETKFLAEGLDLIEKLELRIKELEDSKDSEKIATKEFQEAVFNAVESLSNEPSVEPTVTKINKFGRSKTPHEDTMDRIRKIRNK